MKRQPTEWKKAFANHISVKGLISKIFEELNNSKAKTHTHTHTQKPTLQVLNGQRYGIVFQRHTNNKQVTERMLSIIKSSVLFSRSVVSNSLQSHESQHARPPCPSSTPGVYSNSSPSSRWCHPGISSSVIPFSSCTQSFPASGSFPMSQSFT